MNTSYFIARKILKGGENKRKISRPVVRISILSIILSMVVMIITLAIVKGFQYEVREKIIGFGSHIQIMSSGGASMIESDPFLKNQDIVKRVMGIKGVDKVSPIIYKTGIFQSHSDSVFYKNASGLDTFQVQQEIKGVLFKGIDSSYDLAFFKTNLIQGRLPKYGTEKNNEVLISKRIANQLHFKVDDKVAAFFIQKQPIKRNFVIVGIFETGLEDFDDDIVLADMKTIQDYSGFGIKASLQIEDTLVDYGIVISANAFGGNGNYKFNWGTGYVTASKYLFYPEKDTVFRIIVSDYLYNPYHDEKEATLADTAYLSVKVSANESGFTPFSNVIQRQFLSEDGSRFVVNYADKKVIFELQDGKGSSEHYISGYEVKVHNWEQIDGLDKSVKKALFYWSMEQGNQLEIRNIKQIYGSIFSWLNFLDINFFIIILMMIIISIITMGAALLVLILEKTQAIGILKSMGANNWLIRKVFLIQATYLIIRGLFWGNLIGLGLCFIQTQWHILPLDAAVYYLNAVPVKIDFMQVLLLNLGTLCVCIIALLLPSYFITRISPVKALKYS